MLSCRMKIGCFISLLLLFCGIFQSQALARADRLAPIHAIPLAPPPPIPIKIGVLNNYPYAALGPNGFEGSSIEAFKIIAAQNNWQPNFVLENNSDQLTNAIITHQIDIGIGGITPTPELALVVDYSDANQIVPLALLVKDEDQNAIFWHLIDQTGKVFLSTEMLILLAIGIAAALIGGFLIQRIERRRNPENFPPEFKDNAWWAAQTLVAHNCGSKLPFSERGRYIAILLMLGGTVFTAEITAVLTTTLAASVRVTAPITGIGDIGARPIATVSDSYARIWLQQQLINTKGYDTAADCVQAVEQGQVPGAVLDETVLRHILASGHYKNLKIAGGAFGSHPHAFMLPKRSPYLAPLNASLEFLLGSPEWQKLIAM